MCYAMTHTTAACALWCFALSAGIMTRNSNPNRYESDGEDVTVHVRGLPFSVNYHDVRQFFAPAQIMSKGIHLLRDGCGLTYTQA